MGQGNTHAIGEELPVGKARQGIMVGHLLNLLLRLLALGGEVQLPVDSGD